MPIEFYCPSCNKKLRVKDEAAGQKAKCPGCENILQVPAPNSPVTQPVKDLSAELPGSSQGFADSSSDNPFESPLAHDIGQTPREAVAGGKIRPTEISIGDVFGSAWQIFKGNAGLLIGSLIVLGILANIPNLVMQGLMAAGASPALAIVLVIAQVIIGPFLLAGQLTIYLNVARGKPANFSQMFQGGPYFMRIIGAYIIVSIAAFIGLLLLVIPYVIIILMWSQFVYLIIDKDASIMDSLKWSSEITKGNKLTLFLMGILGAIIGWAGILALGVGVFVTVPYVCFVSTVAYLKMSGQPVAKS